MLLLMMNRQLDQVFHMAQFELTPNSPLVIFASISQQNAVRVTQNESQGKANNSKQKFQQNTTSRL